MADNKPAGNGQKTDEAAKAAEAKAKADAEAKATEEAAAEAKAKADAEAKAAEEAGADTSLKDNLIIERDELASKLTHLNAYLQERRKSPKDRAKDFAEIPDDGTLLQVQRNAMAQYKAVLDARIGNL